MKVIITLILSAFLLTSCSNPDTSGGVTLHKFGPRPADARDCWPQCPQEEPEPDEANNTKEPEPDEANNTKEPEPDPPTSTDEFPHGDCWTPHILGDKSKKTGCGYLPGRHLYLRTYPYNNLKGANLSGANLSGAYLEGAFLRFSNLSGADFRKASLRDSDFSSSDVRGANFSGADLWYAYYVGTKKDKSTVCADGRSWHYWAGGVASCGKPTASPW